MTPFEKIMRVAKQTTMLVTNVCHLALPEPAEWDKTYWYSGSYVCVSEEAALELYELFKEQGYGVFGSLCSLEVVVECLLSDDELGQVIKLPGYESNANRRF
jgi:hypothetical protein